MNECESTEAMSIPQSQKRQTFEAIEVLQLGSDVKAELSE
jgi:hypothetical protein